MPKAWKRESALRSKRPLRPPQHRYYSEDQLPPEEDSVGPAGLMPTRMDRAAFRKAWLYPLRDFMGFCFWVRSYFGSRRTRYRGDLYELLPQGRLRKLPE